MLKVNIKEKSYGNHLVLKDIQFTTDKPGIYGVMGKMERERPHCLNACLV
ncbi:ABC-2 type transport system ATP-binding protein [Myroides profundi]|uniref:ABC-2 type transport system ATP-binding protein n=1 Tax=Myroides profundi TaxID=480520 RepID=A0AAJ4W5Y9_MYRPR|nr:ABC-2 type transport system ATP-binding protein [Myroides profundi]